MYHHARTIQTGPIQFLAQRSRVASRHDVEDEIERLGELCQPRQIVIARDETVTAGPGWGVEISPEWLAQAEHQISEC